MSEGTSEVLMFFWSRAKCHRQDIIRDSLRLRYLMLRQNTALLAGKGNRDKIYGSERSLYYSLVGPIIRSGIVFFGNCVHGSSLA